MKNRKNLLYIIILIILVIGIIILCIRNNSLKNELLNLKNTNLENNQKIEENMNGESEEITEEQAIEIVEDYKLNKLLDTTNEYKLKWVKKETVSIRSRYLTVNGNHLINDKTSDVEVYAVHYALDDETDRFTGYVDINSGELFGIYGEGV